MGQTRPDMNLAKADTAFSGSIPEFYERFLVPLIFEPYADDLVARVARVTSLGPSRLLEIAAGTGVVTRRLANVLPSTVSIVASDLNPPMLDHAEAIGTSRPVEWRQADAMRLPFPDATFDVVVCQFGVMFFPDKPKAFSEARRVLRPGGALLFNAWDRIERNEFANTVTSALAGLFADDPPRFMARVPHGYHDRPAIARDLVAGGFTAPSEFVAVKKRSRVGSPLFAAIAYCQGTPLRNEIEARDPSRLRECTNVAAAAIEARFGSGAVDGEIHANVVMVEP